MQGNPYASLTSRRRAAMCCIDPTHERAASMPSAGARFAGSAPPGHDESRPVVAVDEMLLKSGCAAHDGVQ